MSLPAETKDRQHIVVETLAAAKTFVEAGDWDKATEAFVEVLRLDSREVTALVGLARIAILAKEDTCAAEFLEQASNVIPSRFGSFSFERLGDDSCGWNCLPQLLNLDSIVYCVGCGEDISFDLELHSRIGCTIHAFDPTPRSLQYLQTLSLPNNYRFFEQGLADFDGVARFKPPLDPTHCSHTIAPRPETEAIAIEAPMKRLITIMTELGHSRIDLLKMDIEGAEYSVIEDILNSQIFVSQILVEYHHFMPPWNTSHTLASINRLLQNGYCLFSVHKGTDFSFIKKGQLLLNV